MMRKFCIRLGCAVIALALRVRYRISYVGLEAVCQAIDQNAGHGVLFLPNHPAVIVDPLITASAILKRFPLRPLVTEYMYFSPAFYGVMRLIRALPMPSFTTGVNPLKRKRMEKALSSM